MPLLILRLVVAIGSVAGALGLVNKFTKYSEVNYWNKGKCKKCGGHFKLIEGTMDAPSKGYKCDVCDNCVWISHGSDIGYQYVPSFEAQGKKNAKI